MTENSLSIKTWLLALPCVLDGSVRIDVRGVYPVAICGLMAREIRTRDTMIYFVIEAL